MENSTQNTVSPPTTTTTTATTITTTKFVPFTTTTQTPKTTLTAFNQFKDSAFAPFSVFTSTHPTVSYATETKKSLQNFKKFNIIATTARPTFGIASQFNVKPTVAQTKSIFPPFSWFGSKSSTQNSIAPIATKTANQQTVAVVRNNFFATTATTPTTPKATFASNPYAVTFSPPTKAPSTISTQSSTAKINLFDLYLGRLTTKKPARYTFPTVSPLSNQLITFPSPYTVRTSPSTSTQVRSPRVLNTYRLPDYFNTKSTTPKPSSDEVQSVFEAQASRFAQSLGILNIANYQQLTGVATTPKPRVWRYSFSGTTSSSGK